MNDTLKPCPCGGAPSKGDEWRVDFGGDNVVVEYIICDTCHAEISTLNSADIEADWNTRAAPTVKPLAWDVDGRSVRLDDGMMMGHGYDWDGWELMRAEAFWEGVGYAIWPDHISSDVFSLYCTADGWYKQNLSEGEAKAAAQSDHATRILSALEDAA